MIPCILLLTIEQDYESIARGAPEHTGLMKVKQHTTQLCPLRKQGENQNSSTIKGEWQYDMPKPVRCNGSNTKRAGRSWL